MKNFRSISGTRLPSPCSAGSTCEPSASSSISFLNSIFTGSLVSVAMVSRPLWMLWPARMVRVNRSIASGSISSNFFRRRERTCRM